MQGISMWMEFRERKVARIVQFGMPWNFKMDFAASFLSHFRDRSILGKLIVL